ncbi:CHAT domain-containing protein [Actinophytocola sp.]|uniref:CHAT domain-containing protein n=1 Tax=Actinophytocola sp. TaxID=1872138 RepID=UPI002ED59445
MSADSIERRIAELEADMAGLPPGSAELRAARAKLVALLTDRYVRHGGSEDDRRRAREIGQAVLDDDAVTDAERQRTAMLLTVLTMFDASAAAVFRDRPTLDAEALRRTQKWQETADPARITAGIAELQERLRTIPGVENLPPVVQTMFGLVGRLVPLINTGADGPGAAEAAADLATVVEQADPDVPGLDLVRLLVTWLRPTPGPNGERVAEIEAALATLSTDHLLAPVLRGDLAQALLADGTAGIDGIERATRLLEHAAAGMAEDHPLYDETVRRLAGALVATAAANPSEMTVARAETVVAEVLRQSGPHEPERRGPDALISSLVRLLRGVAGDERQRKLAVRDLLDAIDLLPAGHALRPAAVGQLGALLADRHLMAGVLEEAESAHHILARAAAAVSADDASGAVLAGLVAVHRVSHAIRVEDVAGLPAATAALRAAVERLPAEQVSRAQFELVLAVGDLWLASRTGADLRTTLASIRRIAARDAIPGIPPAGVTAVRGAVSVLDGLMAADPEIIVRAIGDMESHLATTTEPTRQQAMLRAMIGKAYLMAPGADRDQTARLAVGHLVEAERLLDAQRAGMARTDVLRELASAYRMCGDHDRSRRTAFEVLAGHAGTVLLQTGIAHAIVTARGASADAVALARWCLADGDHAGAVQAVELGRGLALHAATSSLALPTVLRRVGRPDLADAWVADIAARATEPLPWSLGTEASDADVDHSRAIADLRHDVLAVLRRTAEGMRLLTAPSTADIGAALTRADADALAYLLPGDENTAGHLLVVDRHGATAAVSAPALRIEPDGPPVRFARTDKQDDDWRPSLAAVCDWAGTAVLAPLLEKLGRGRAPARIVLVPFGVLGAVPWPAARIHDGSAGPRFACADVVLSTAASARQFIDATTRTMLPLEREQVLVADPHGGLPFAVDEVLALRDHFYPDALVFGTFGTVEHAAGDDPVSPPDGTGTPAQILDRMPGDRALGSSLLHLGCHARAMGSAEASYLALTEPLTIREVLDHGAGRAVDAPGPLIVLSACQSDLTVQDYDEALTLTTAFLAAGAVAVVGSRWPVDDQSTAVMMFAFHHFLVRERQRPADALRSAQLWMLGPDRAELPDMPETMLGDLTTIEPADVAAWGAFSHHGR